MADEVASLVVKITGDASGLSRTISQAGKELDTLGKKEAGATNSSTQKEINALNKALKQTRSEFRLTDAQLKNSGTELDRLNNKYSSLKLQLTQQEALTRKYSDALTQLSNEQKTARSNLEQATTAWKKQRDAVNAMENPTEEAQKELSRLASEVTKAEKAVRSADNTYDKWNSGLINSRIGEEKLKTAINETTTAIEKQKKKTEELNNTQKKTEELNNTQKKSSFTEKMDDLDAFGEKTKSVGEAIDDVTKPAQVASAAILAGGVASAKFAMDFESNMAGVARVSNISGEELERLKDGIIDISQTTPSTTAELTSFAEAGGRLIKNTDGLLEFSRVMAELGVATDMSGSQAAESMAQFANLTGMADNDFRRLGSTVVALGNNFVTGESKIMDMAQRLGAAGKAVGMTEADILGLSAALSSLGLEPDAGGSAISTILMEIETLVGKGEGFEVFAEAAEMSADKFKEAWDEDATGTFLTFLEKLGQSPNIAGVLSELGIDEIRQRDAVMRLAQSFGVLDSAITTSNQAWQENTALQNEFTTQASTTEAQMQIAKNNIVEAGRSIGESLLPFVEDGAVMIADLAEGIADMSEESRENLLKVGTAIVGIGAAGKGISSAVKVVGDMTSGVATIGKALSKIPLSAGLAAAGITAVGVAAGVAYDNYVHWADGGYELAESLETNVEKLTELDGLLSETKELELIIKNPDSSEEQINSAKSRLEEIRSYLAEEYDLDINVPLDELDTALEKLNELTYTELRVAGVDARQYIDDNSTRYKEDKADIAAAEINIPKLKEDKLALADFKETYLDLLESLNSGEIERSDFVSQMNAFFDTLNRPDIYDFWEMLAPSDAMSYDWAMDRLNSELDEYTERSEAATEQTNEFEANLAAVADAGIAAIAQGDISSGIENLKKVLSEQKEVLSADEYFQKSDGFAQMAASAMSGVESFSQAAAAGGDTLDKFIQNYAAAGEQLGLTGNEILMQSALMKEGFTDIASAADAGALSEVYRSFSQLGQEAGYTTAEIAQLAEEMGLIPENMHVVIDAKGNVEVIENAKELTEETDGTRATVILDADEKRAKAAINGVLYDLGEYDKETGTATLYGNNGEAIAAVDIAVGRVQWFNTVTGTALIKADDQTGGGVSSAQESIGAVTNSPHEAVITASDQTESGIAQARSRLQSFVNTPWSTTLTVKVASPKLANIVTPEAKGTTNFPGGLAVINDQRGIPDPRELVIHNNKGYIFEGRDVVVPLDKGDKVYTAAETKRMLPHLAGGQNNSDAFTAARDDWDFYTSTHAVTTTQELEKWVQLSKEFLDNQQDVRDIEREIYGLTRDVNDELNETSLSYIETHAAMNDWADIGDDPLSAWERVRERNLELLNEGKLTWEEYSDIIAEAGETAYSARLDQSYDWLEHEREYNDMSADDYLAGLDRMRAYTQEYYEKGLIDHRTYRESMSELDDKYIDGVRENLETLNENSLDWISDRASLNDWDKYADDPVQAFIRIRNRNLEAFNAGDITWDMYHDNLADTGSEIVSAVDDAFMEELNISRDYLGMSDREFLQSLDKRWEMVDEFYRNGMLSETEYGEYMQEIAADRYDAASEIYADMLDETRSQIDSINEFYSDKISGLQDVWETGDRAEDMAETREQMEVFEGAVTAQGMRQYEEYAQQLRELERDEEIYRLEQEQATALDALEYEYTRIEEEQSDALRAIYTATENASALAERMISAVETGFRETVSAVASSAQNISNYADNRNINITAADDTALTAFLRKFSWLGGMLS